MILEGAGAKIAAGLLAVTVPVAGFSTAAVTYKQMNEPTIAQCSLVKGGHSMAATGTRIAEGISQYFVDFVEAPQDDEGMFSFANNVVHEVVIDQWWESFLRPLFHMEPSPKVLEVRQKAAEEAAAAEQSCTPCPGTAAQTTTPTAALANTTGDTTALKAPVVANLGAHFGEVGSWSRYHTGQDYRAPMGMEVRVVKSGTVVFAGNTGDWAGNHVAVKHADGYTTMYSHLSAINVSKGQTITTGTVIGKVGNTGRSFGPHLHFEAYPPGVQYGNVYKAVDPLKYLKGEKPTVGDSYGGVGANASGVAEQAAAQYFPVSQVPMAVAIAGAESSWNATATNHNTNGSTDYGMWQINSVHGSLLASGDWRNVNDNARMAYQVWKDAGQSWTPWSTFNDGSYKKFLNASTAVPGQGDQADASLSAQGNADADPKGTDCGVDARIATWNVLKGNGQGPAGAKAIAAQADVISFQELSSERERAAVAAALGSGWGMTTDRTAVPIAWNKSRYDLIQQNRVQALGVVQVEGMTVGPKWITWAQLRDKISGQTFYQVNVHMLWDVDRKGVALKGHPKRIAAYQAQMAKVVSVVNGLRSGKEPVVVTSDWNVDYGSAMEHEGGLLSPLSAAGLVSNWQSQGELPTHGHRTIDGAWVTGAKFTSQTVMPKYGSDHSPVIVSLGSTTGAPTAVIDGISRGKAPSVALPTAGMTPDNASVMRCIAVRYPRIKTISTYPGHEPDMTRATDAMISGAFDDYKSAEAQAYGWRIAEWLKANHAALGVHYVIFSGRIWNVDRDGEGWRTYKPIAGPGDSSMHINHVHVSVFGNKGTATGGTTCNI